MRGAAFLAGVVAIVGAEALASAQTITTLRGIERLPRMKPVEQGSHRCADIGKTKSGDNLDSLTNRLKNRIDMASTFGLTTIGTLLKLPFDATDRSGGDMPRSRNGWKAADRTRAARYESRAVAVDGYIIAEHGAGWGIDQIVGSATRAGSIITCGSCQPRLKPTTGISGRLWSRS